jgi:type I restriction enzyme R subunit
MVLVGRTRADFAGQFEALTGCCNAGSRSIGQLFEELLKLSRRLDDEAQRHVRENMSEEELVVFDILTRSTPACRAPVRPSCTARSARRCSST